MNFAIAITRLLTGVLFASSIPTITQADPRFEGTSKSGFEGCWDISQKVPIQGDFIVRIQKAPDFSESDPKYFLDFQGRRYSPQFVSFSDCLLTAEVDATHSTYPFVAVTIGFQNDSITEEACRKGIFDPVVYESDEDWGITLQFTLTNGVLFGNRLSPVVCR